MAADSPMEERKKFRRSIPAFFGLFLHVVFDLLPHTAIEEKRSTDLVRIERVNRFFFYALEYTKHIEFHEFSPPI